MFIQWKFVIWFALCVMKQRVFVGKQDKKGDCCCFRNFWIIDNISIHCRVLFDQVYGCLWCKFFVMLSCVCKEKCDFHVLQDKTEAVVELRLFLDQWHFDHIFECVINIDTCVCVSFFFHAFVLHVTQQHCFYFSWY